MAAALKLAKRTTTEGLIEEAGDLQKEIAAKTERYKYVRRELASRMTIPEDQESLEITSGGYVAKLFYKKKTRIIPEKLKELKEGLFWRACQIPVSAVKEFLDRDEFYVVSEEIVEPIPELNIRKAKEE